MPDCSARSTAVRVTWSMSISRFSSSWIRYSMASVTCIRRFLVRWPKEAGKDILDIDVHLFHALRRDDFERGHAAVAHLHFHFPFVQLAFAKLGAEFFPRALELLLGGAARPSSPSPAFFSRFALTGREEAAAGRASAPRHSARPFPRPRPPFLRAPCRWTISTRSRIIDSTSRPT